MGEIKSFSDELKKKYGNCLKPLSDISKSNPDSEAVINSELMVYDFDMISQQVYGLENFKGTSADAIYVINKNIILIEVKTGFNDSILLSKRPELKDNFCEKYENKIDDCLIYSKLRQKYDKLYFDKLKDSLKLKAVESYMLLKEMVKNIEKYRVSFFVVVNNPLEKEEEILADLAKVKLENNICIRVKESMKRFRKNNKRSYYFDEIDVYLPQEIEEKIEKYQKSKEK